MIRRDWKNWGKCALVRAIKTVAQTLVGVIGASTVLEGVDWSVAVSSAVLPGAVSLLTSIAGLPEVENNANIKPE